MRGPSVRRRRFGVAWALAAWIGSGRWAPSRPCFPVVVSKQPTVLVVDDDPIVLEVTRERLERAGFDVRTRDQSLGTSQYIMQHAPDFVLLDVMMPALNGGELAGMLQRRNISTGVVLFSSKPEDELADIVARSGAIGGLSKALSDEEFLLRFRALVAQHLATRGAAPR